jgi:hypothetical protein
MQSCNFKQTFRLSPARQRSKFESVGLQASVPVYQTGNHSELLKALDARPPIVDTIAESLAAAWPRILHSTLAHTCSRIVHGLTTKTLIEDVRSSHQWCLLDVVSLLVRRDLAGGWSLEAIMRLPALAKEPVSCSAAIESKGNEDEDEEESEEEGGVEYDESAAASPFAAARYSFVTKVLQAAVHLHTKSHSGSARDTAVSTFSTHARVDCTSCAMASTLPLYLSFMTMVELAVPHGVSIARARKTGRSDQLRMDEITLRAYIASSDEHAYLNEALQMIESAEALWYAWVSDFVMLSLRYSDHTEQEVHLLVRIAEILVHAGCTNANEAHRNVLRWVLLQDDLRRYLFPASRAIQGTCRAFPELVGEMDCLQFTSVEDFAAQLLRKTLHRAWECLWESPGRSEPPASAGTSRAAVLDCLRYCFATPELSPPSAAFASCGVLCTATEQNRFTAMVGLLKLSAVFDADTVLIACPKENAKAAASADPSMLTALTEELRHLGLSQEAEAPSADPLRAMLVTLGTVFALQSDDCTKRRAVHLHGLLDCLHWALTCRESGYSLWLASLVECLLKTTSVSVVFEADQRARSVISCLLVWCDVPTNARAQLLCLCLGKFSLATERAIDRSLLQLTAVGYARYTPEAIVEVVREQSSSGGLPTIGRYPPLPAATEASAWLLFRAYFLNLRAEFEDRPGIGGLAQRAEELALSTTSSSLIAQSAVTKLTLDKFACMLRSAATTATAAASGASGKSAQSLTGRFAKTDVLAVRKLLDQDPGQVWPYYLLAVIGDPSVLVAILGDKSLLTVLGLRMWVCDRFQPLKQGAKLTEDEARRRQADARLMSMRVAHLLRISHAMRTAMAVNALTADCTPRHIMSSVTTQSQEGNEARDKPALDMMQLFGSQDSIEGLPANKHIPALVAMSLFLLEKLAFRLRNSGQIADLAVEKALEMLPLAEKLTGEAKFTEFLAAWKELRSAFGTFNQCGGELATANEIPELTDRRGANPARVMDLVAVEDFPDHVPMVRRMLELRLLLQTSNIVTHPAVQALQETTLAGKQAAEQSLSEQEVEGISEHVAHSLLVTNPLQDVTVRSEVDFLVMSLSVGSAAANGALAVSVAEAGAEVSLEQYIAATQLQMARDNQLQAHREGLGCCPNCGCVVCRYTGCDNVSCGRPYDPYATQGSTHMAKVGCGTPFNISRHRVPAPSPSGDVLDFFKPTRVHIPAHILDLQLPLLPPVSVTYRLDCVPIALQLLKLGVSGRPKLILGNRIKRPLQLIPPLSADNAAVVKEVALDPAELSADTNVFARLRYASDLLWGTDAPLQSTELREFKSILLNQPEAMMETIAGVLLRGCLCVSAVLQRDTDGAATTTGTMKMSTVVQNLTFGEIVATYLAGDEPPKVRMPLRTSQVIDALPYGQLPGAVHLLCEAGLNSWGISGNRSAAPLPSACAKHWKELQAEILAAAAQESAAAVVITPSERGHGQEKVRVVQAQLQTLSTLLQGKRDHFAVMPDDVLIRSADGAIQAFLMQPSNALLHKLVAELELRHIPALERAIRVILGNIAYCALSGGNRSGRSSTITPEEGDRAQTAAPSARPVYTECAGLTEALSALPDAEKEEASDVPPVMDTDSWRKTRGAFGDLARVSAGAKISYPLRYGRDALIAQGVGGGAAAGKAPDTEADSVQGLGEHGVSEDEEAPEQPAMDDEQLCLTVLALAYARRSV